MTALCSVYVVEDDEANLASLTELIKSEFPDCNVKAFQSAIAALSSLLKNKIKPDLIITDLRMKGLSGEDFIKMTKSTPSIAGIPTIVITAIHDSKIPQLDNCIILRKPFEINLLIETLYKHAN